MRSEKVEVWLRSKVGVTKWASTNPPAYEISVEDVERVAVGLSLTNYTKKPNSESQGNRKPATGNRQPRLILLLPLFFFGFFYLLSQLDHGEDDYCDNNGSHY